MMMFGFSFYAFSRWMAEYSSFFAMLREVEKQRRIAVEARMPIGRQRSIYRQVHFYRKTVRGICAPSKRSIRGGRRK